MEKKPREQYSAEFKAKVVKEMLKVEKTVGQLAAEYGDQEPFSFCQSPTPSPGEWMPFAKGWNVGEPASPEAFTRSTIAAVGTAR